LPGSLVDAKMSRYFHGITDEEAALSENLLPMFKNDAQKLSLTEDAQLFTVGDASNGKMYILLEGQAEIVVGNYIVELAKPGAIIGELALIDQEPRSATVRCATQCEFAMVDEKRFLLLIQQTPMFAMELLKVLAARLRSLNRTL
jgi:CRP/FNR family transcriptional regulator, cyclic AMP receptor protein